MAPALADTAADLAARIAYLSTVLEGLPLPAPVAETLEEERDSLALEYLRRMLHEVWP